MNFDQQWQEYDYNPFILFSSDGKILSLNSEAQFLINSFNAKEIFELATTYANVSFGFKTTFVDLEFGRYKFFGLTVGYENEEEIGIKLYQAPSFKLNPNTPSGELVNIYTLVDLCIATNSINSKAKFIKELDPTIPEIIVDSNNFIKVLNKIYACFIANENIYTKIYYKVGEHVRFGDKKYSLFAIEVFGNNRDKQREKELYTIAKNNEVFVDIKKKITINLPMITS